MVSQPQNSFLTPLVLMSLIALGLGGLTYWEQKKGTRLRGIDFTLFLLTGLSGCLFLTMWIATDHLATHINLNMLWAFPPHAVLAFWLLKRKVGKFLCTYLQVFAIFQLLLVVDWFVLPQQYHIASLPIILLLAVRAWIIARQKV
jgi:GR25 family glycosyltransferase involved in LPS biosynthesis